MESWSNITSVDDVVSIYKGILHLGDDRVQNMLLMQSPVPITLISLFYTYFVISLGPRLMMDRKPFHLKGIIAVYNVFQVVFNAVLFAYSIKFWWTHYGWGLSCLPVRPANLSEEESTLAARLCHLYFINKVIDLLDTVFFILKKKSDKISVLHVFHHAAMPFSVWFGVKFHPGGNLAFFGLPNLFVHIWMYLYYLVAILGPKYQKYIWWKRHLTEMQLVQFGMVALYMGYVSLACNLNRIFVTWIIALDVIFIGLFTNFYIKAYRRRKTQQEEAKRLEEKTQ